MTWIYLIIVGGLSGFLASTFMKGKGLGLIWNVILGIVGVSVGKYAFGFLGIAAVGTLGIIMQGFLGAVIVLGLANVLTK